MKLLPTDYYENTPKKVRDVLDLAIKNHLSENSLPTIYRLMLGDPVTGKNWLEENDVVGMIGRSTGTKKVPLLLEPLLSAGGAVVSDSGGSAILTANILRIVDVSSGRDLYRASNYVMPELVVTACTNEEGYTHQVTEKDVLVARFKSLEDATEYTAFLQGHKLMRPLQTVAEAEAEYQKFSEETQAMEV